jgi:hypothetical protein
MAAAPMATFLVPVPATIESLAMAKAVWPLAMSRAMKLPRRLVQPRS